MNPVKEYHSKLLVTPHAMEYLDSRRVSIAARRVYGLGYFDLTELSPFYDRLMIPIRDVYGELLSFQGRALYDYEARGKPKYYHASFDKGRMVYGLYEVAEMAMRLGYVVIVEGPMDAIALWDAGVPAIALMGTTFSIEQAYLIRRYAQYSVLWLDADKAGATAAINVRAVLKSVDMDVKEVPKFRAFKDASEAWGRAGFDGIARILNGRS